MPNPPSEAAEVIATLTRQLAEARAALEIISNIKVPWTTMPRIAADALSASAPQVASLARRVEAAAFDIDARARMKP